MKRYFAAVLLLTTILLTGCYKWDYSTCPVDDNFELRFRLVGADGSDLFAGRVNTIDITLFDAEGNFAMHRKVQRTQLDADNGIRLTVDPGTYYVVAWANLGDNSMLSPMTPGVTFETSTVEVISDETGEQLYYAPYTGQGTRGLNPDFDYTSYKVVLPPGKYVEKELDLVRAHRTINVFIEGLDNIAAFPGGLARVKVCNIPYKYDFYMIPDTGRKDYIRTTRTTTTRSGDMLTTSFSAPIADFDDLMTLHILNPGDDTELVDPLYLNTWVKENVPDDINEFDIMFTISKSGETVEVDISIPEWENIGVNPGDL